VSIFNDAGRLRHRRGVTEVPGLYFVGLTWQHTRGSALIGFVKDDAEFIAERIAAHEQSTAPAQAGTSVGTDTGTEVRSTERS
jgi:putative flavoprotein involved in K+ transport